VDANKWSGVGVGNSVRYHAGSRCNKAGLPGLYCPREERAEHGPDFDDTRGNSRGRPRSYSTLPGRGAGEREDAVRKLIQKRTDNSGLKGWGRRKKTGRPGDCAYRLG